MASSSLLASESILLNVVGATAYSIKSIYGGESDVTGIGPNLEFNGEKFSVKNGSLNFNIVS
ncbi:MAG: hypothetical protein ACJAX5_001589 [Patiriisocius sp.]|jgi:hypothetical protein